MPGRYQIQTGRATQRYQVHTGKTTHTPDTGRAYSIQNSIKKNNYPRNGNFVVVMAGS